MPGWCRLTDYVVLIAVVILVLYNITAGIAGGGEATISARLQHHATRYPIIPFAIGGLCMHWFWPIFGIRE